MSLQALTLNFSDLRSYNTDYKYADSDITDQANILGSANASIDNQQVEQFIEPDSSVLFLPSLLTRNNTQSERVSSVQTSFVAEQEWEGYVTQVTKEDFTAHLIDLSAPGIEEEACFSIDEVSNIHKELLKEGAIFRWSIGYERVRGGTKRKVSSIIFRRLPAWTKKDLSKSLSEAESFQKNIIWE